jgi:hypothetical protein
VPVFFLQTTMSLDGRTTESFDEVKNSMDVEITPSPDSDSEANQLDEQLQHQIDIKGRPNYTDPEKPHTPDQDPIYVSKNSSSEIIIPFRERRTIRLNSRKTINETLSTSLGQRNG